MNMSFVCFCKRGLIFFGFSMLLTMCVSGCAHSGQSRQAVIPGFSGPALKVGVTPNMPPLVYRQGGEVVGLEIDLARALGQALGRPLDFVELRWEEQIPALRAGKTDIIMSGMSVTQLREMRISFSEPYLRVGQLALARRAEAERFLGRGAVLMYGGRVGVEKGTTGDIFVQSELTRCERVAYTRPALAVRDLIAGRLGIFIHDAPLIWWLAAENEDRGLAVINMPLTTEYLAWGLRNEDQELLTAVNNVLAGWKRERRLQGFVRRWLPYVQDSN